MDELDHFLYSFKYKVSFLVFTSASLGLNTNLDYRATHDYVESHDTVHGAVAQKCFRDYPLLKLNVY